MEQSGGSSGSSGGHHPNLSEIDDDKLRQLIAKSLERTKAAEAQVNAAAKAKEQRKAALNAQLEQLERLRERLAAAQAQQSAKQAEAEHALEARRRAEAEAEDARGRRAQEAAAAAEAAAKSRAEKLERRKAEARERAAERAEAARRAAAERTKQERAVARKQARAAARQKRQLAQAKAERRRLAEAARDQKRTAKRAAQQEERRRKAETQQAAQEQADAERDQKRATYRSTIVAALENCELQLGEEAREARERAVKTVREAENAERDLADAEAALEAAQTEEDDPSSEEAVVDRSDVDALATEIATLNLVLQGLEDHIRQATTNVELQEEKVREAEAAVAESFQRAAALQEEQRRVDHERIEKRMQQRRKERDADIEERGASLARLGEATLQSEQAFFADETTQHCLQSHHVAAPDGSWGTNLDLGHLEQLSQSASAKAAPCERSLQTARTELQNLKARVAALEDPSVCGEYVAQVFVSNKGMKLVVDSERVHV